MCFVRYGVVFEFKFVKFVNLKILLGRLIVVWSFFSVGFDLMWKMKVLIFCRWSGWIEFFNEFDLFDCFFVINNSMILGMFFWVFMKICCMIIVRVLLIFWGFLRYGVLVSLE